MMSQQDVEKREKTLRMAMEKVLPDFVKSCRENVGPLLIHQDAFGVDYDGMNFLGWQSSLRDCMEKKSASSAKIGTR